MRIMRGMEQPWMFERLAWTLPDETALASLAQTLARFAVVGDLIRLQGELGAGKTTFAGHFIHALGHKGEVPSPTYTLVQTYDDTRLPVAHVDCYRLNDPAELDGLGLESFRKGGLIIAEWPDKGGDLLAAGQPDTLPYHINNPDNGGTLDIILGAGETPDSRTVELVASRSWQHRYGLIKQLGPHRVSRAVTEENRRTFLKDAGMEDAAIEALAPEWSFRSYWRIRPQQGESLVLMDAPPPFESVATFARVADYYRSIGLRTATIEKMDAAHGYLLTEDLGTRRLLELVESGTDTRGWYETAADVLVTMCKSSPPAWARSYTNRDWWIEMARFTDWYMPLARGRQTSPEERVHFASLWQPLFGKVMSNPVGLLPWDYQATNMMLLGDEPAIGNFGLIDIQDARVAPICQDLAILLRDIRRDRDDVLEATILDKVATDLALDRTQLQEAVEIANLQHCVRILGGLARSALRDDAWGGASAFMARTWEVAHQSYDCPALANIVTYLKPLEEAGMDTLTKRSAAA